MKGKLITFEGVEGSGKTTQLKMIEKSLIEEGYKVRITREPGGTKIGNKIREILLNPLNNILDYKAEILLYAADRAQDLKENILPALKAGEIVLADRYIDSNIAYQGFGRDLDLSMVRKINEWVINGYWPDLTLILDIDIEKGIKRAKSLSLGKTGDRLEQEVLEFHQKVRDAFITMAKEDRCVLINADQKPEILHREIFKIVKESLL